MIKFTSCNCPWSVVLSGYSGFFHTKTGRHAIAESGVKHQKSINHSISTKLCQFNSNLWKVTDDTNLYIKIKAKKYNTVRTVPKSKWKIIKFVNDLIWEVSKERYFLWDDDALCVELGQHAELDFYNTSPINSSLQAYTLSSLLSQYSLYSYYMYLILCA